MFVKKNKNKENHSLQVDNDENRALRLQLRELIAHKDMSDSTLQKIIWHCAIKGWVEELRLCVNVPRSSVEYLLYIDCVLFELCKILLGIFLVYFFVLFHNKQNRCLILTKRLINMDYLHCTMLSSITTQ